ncbi:MAG: pyruvate, phosphate dikinase [Jiangellales bacterium]
MPTYVYHFAQGNKDQKDLLGGKGANLAEMTNMGLPVPPGFTVTTEACQYYLHHGSVPDELAAELSSALADVEKATGKGFGDPDSPLLLSVRSGGKFSMPGMMDTVLNIGLNEHTIDGLVKATGNERFVWDSYRRLIHMFGDTVLGIDGELFEHVMDEEKAAKGTASDLDLDAQDLARLAARYKEIVAEQTGQPFPDDPHTQVDLAIKAVFESWNTERAILYRRQERIPGDLGTAVNVQSMVFGNMGSDSYTGVAFTRDPATGEPGVYGDWLEDAQGEDVVAGIRNAHALAELEAADKPIYDELLGVMARLEEHYRDLCDIEFTIERGKLWMLQTRVGKRTAAAAFIIASHMVDERLIDMDEALRRVNGAQLTHLMFPHFDLSAASAAPLTTAVAASPGAAVGRIVFDSHDAQDWADRGETVLLVRRETTPDDLKGMVAANGILTTRGGKTSHAAVVARGMGTTCVCGAEDLDIDLAGKTLTSPDGSVYTEGDVLSIDGTSGRVYAGEVPVQDSPVVQYFEGKVGVDHDPLVSAVHRILTHADERRRLRVRANSDTGDDSQRARRFGAEGIGLCRTEHMFLGERRQRVEDLILADTDEGRQVALDELEPLQKGDYLEILEAMDGLPVIVRLLDPPLHEFLPALTELEVESAIATERGTQLDADRARVFDAVRRMHEQNPMLGLRGVRLGLVIEGLYEMQVRALAEAAAELVAAGKNPRPEVMIPLTAAVQEYELMHERASAVLQEVQTAYGVQLSTPIGTMIEVPRAALTAGQIAEQAEFFSFGTNDLTQMTWAFSRDDVEGEFFGRYLELGVFGVSPFESLDTQGVGQLVELATKAGKAVNPHLEVGVCGEHGGDPASIHFFDAVGVDYVSCSPFRVPVARLEAGRAALLDSPADVR